MSGLSVYRSNLLTNPADGLMFFFCSFVTNNHFPRSNQSMTNKTFIADFVALAFVFLAGYAFMIVA